MRQSIGMHAQLNLIVVFIAVVFGLISASLSYYKAFKINNTIVNSIEKYEGYNTLSQTEISNNLEGLGYPKKTVSCDGAENLEGYCVYLDSITKKDGNVKSYSYEVITYMNIELPIFNMLRIPVKASTTQIACIKGDCKSL